MYSARIYGVKSYTYIERLIDLSYNRIEFEGHYFPPYDYHDEVILHIINENKYCKIDIISVEVEPLIQEIRSIIPLYKVIMHFDIIRWLMI